MNLAITAAEIARVAEQIAPMCDGDEQLLADMLEGETSIDRVIQRLHNIIADDEAMTVGIAARQSNLADRKARIEKRIKTTKAAIGQILRAAKLTSFALPEVTYTVRGGNQKLEVTDKLAVPLELCETKASPSMAKINEAFKDADKLPNWLVREPAKDVVTARTK